MRNPHNQAIIEEFRANGGDVGGTFAGVPIALLHHRGRHTGVEYVAPVVYLADKPDEIFIFASNGGASTHPHWYENIRKAGTVTIEIGTDCLNATVTEVDGPRRDELFAEQALRHPRFAAYEHTAAAAGRTIPVLVLQPIQQAGRRL